MKRSRSCYLTLSLVYCAMKPCKPARHQLLLVLPEHRLVSANMPSYSKAFSMFSQGQQADVFRPEVAGLS